MRKDLAQVIRPNKFMDGINSIQEAEFALNCAKFERNKDKVRHARGKLKFLKKKAGW